MSDQRPRTTEEAVERVGQAIADLVALQLGAAVEPLAREHAKALRQAARPRPPEVRFWFSTRQAAERASRHQTTVARALQDGTLHGSQSKPGAQWRIHVDCLEAWIAHKPCPHEEGGGR